MAEPTQRSAPRVPSAGGRPVAAVVVATGLAHLDRVFEYAIPDELTDTAQPGVRVRVRFAGRDLDGFVVERRHEARHEGPLAPLRRVVSPEPVLTPDILALVRAVADRYAGTRGDVLRLAVPKRHAAAERALTERALTERALTERPPEQVALVPPPEPGPWSAYPAGPSLVRRVGRGENPAASWLALPGQRDNADWPAALAVLAVAAVSAGRGAVIVVPDHRDVDRVDSALRTALGAGRHVRLTAAQGPHARYTAWLSILRGHVQCVVGTRAAMFAPVRNLGLVAWWDDGDDLLAEPRAPYPHVREVLMLRAAQSGAAAVSGGFARSVDQQLALESGRVHAVAAAPAQVRATAPRVLVAGEGLDGERDGPGARAHLPSLAWRTARTALERGPVLIQVPRRGYLPALSCQSCRAPVHCLRCKGPVAVAAQGAAAACRWCGTPMGADGFVCPHCEGRALRSTVVGAGRTAEELGRAFAGVPVHTSGGEAVLGRVSAAPGLVIATPGAEPVADGGYAAVLLLDAWALLDRPSLDAGSEALRRWMAAAALARTRADGGVVVLAGAPGQVTLAPVEALVRWDPGWLAERELAERRELRLPPAVTMAQVVASRHTLAEVLACAELPDGAERFGPLPRSAGPGRHDQQGLLQVLLRVEPAERAALAAALAHVRAVRSARKETDPLTIRLDPADPVA